MMIQRGHPNYRGLGPWRDWAWVDYGSKEGEVACHIWCFAVIPDMKGKRLNYGETRLEEGVFAVVECWRVVQEKEDRRQLDILCPS